MDERTPSRMRARRVGWNVGLYAAAGLLLVFMLLPIVALLATLGWSEFIEGIQNRAVLPALKLSFRTTFTSLVIVVVFGTPLAWILSRRTGRLVHLIETLVRLPVVLPPAVAGVALLLTFGQQGILGKWLVDLGISVSFSTTAVIIAEVFVSAPFFLQAATSAFRQIDESLLVVARSLGAGPARVFFRVALPLALPGMIAGAAMSWARALGEFGATLMFAGNSMGKTQTLTLAVYETWESRTPRAAQAMSVVLVIVAFTLLFFLTRSQSRRGGER